MKSARFLIFYFLFSSLAFGQSESDLNYSSGGGTFQFYDGSAWQDMDFGSTGNGCSTAGSLQYNSGQSRMEFCNGSEWRTMMGTNTGSACIVPGSFYYDFTNHYYLYCNGAFLWSSTILDVTPNAINWADFTNTSASQSFAGINTSINIEITATLDSGSPTLQYQKNAGGWTTFTVGSPPTLSISNGDSLSFKVLGSVSNQATFTITNLSDSSTVLDTVVGTVGATCTSGRQIYASAGSFNYTIPADCSNAIVRIWGAGGGGGGDGGGSPGNGNPGGASSVNATYIAGGGSGGIGGKSAPGGPGGTGSGAEGIWSGYDGDWWPSLGGAGGDSPNGGTGGYYGSGTGNPGGAPGGGGSGADAGASGGGGGGGGGAYVVQRLSSVGGTTLNIVVGAGGTGGSGGATGGLGAAGRVEIYYYSDTSSFITEWKVSAGQSITLPLYSGGSYNFTADWGDGTSSAITSDTDPDGTHTFASAGTYLVVVTGSFDRFYFNNVGSKALIYDILQWGTNPWVEMDHAFWGCSKLFGSAQDIPDISNVTNMWAAFAGATIFDGKVANWDTSNVTNMQAVFSGDNYFNHDVSSWDMSSVTNISYMFYNAASFNQSLNSWNVSNVTTAYYTFYRAFAYNQPMNNWVTTSLQNVSHMFEGTSTFNQDISGWNMSSVTDFSYMFYQNGIFNQPVGSWNTSSAINMDWMFFGLSDFNTPLNSWNVSNVTSMNGMFNSTGSFNQNLNSWTTTSLTSMSQMFAYNPVFNGNCSTWNVSSVVSYAGYDTNTTAWQTVNKPALP